MVNLEDYHTLFLVATLGLTLVVASPALALIVPLQDFSEDFSELWLLGSGHVTRNYPFIVSENGEYRVFVGVGNNMGSSEYYTVYVKFRNWSQSAPDVSESIPSSLSPLLEFRFFIEDGIAWESPVTFSFQNVTVENNVMSVNRILLNDIAFPIDASTSWSSENNGHFFQLFFELWRYDVASQSFQFHDRVVGITLKMMEQ
jgi:uncharacterized membrane protein